MQRFLLFCLILLLCSLKTLAQQGSVQGELVDSVNFKPLAYSSVSLLRAKDSLLIAHQWTNQQNKFHFIALPPDTYLIQVTRPTFADYEDKFILHADEMIDLGPLAMIGKLNLLREVIVREKLDAIRMKGDTTEFLADSFQVKHDATVEDLLKRLPGIQVDKSGKITAQGKTVEKVLVDGEEFFGDDPTVATQNLKAKQVESVQVFDKKSDAAIQTGIDDGEKTKTINLKMKEDAKKGYFGKAVAGFGTDSIGSLTKYQHEFMLNSFKNKRKLAFFTATSNTNKTKLNWDDANKYSSGYGETTVDESSGSVTTYYSDQMEDVNFNGKGIPTTTYAGGHYSNKFNNDKLGVNINVTQKSMQVNGIDNVYTKYILPDTLYYNNQYEQFSNRRNAAKTSGTITNKIDSMTTLKLVFSANQGDQSTDDHFVSENKNGNDSLVNNNNRHQLNQASNKGWNATLSYNKRFQKKGRSMNMSVTGSMTNNTGDGHLLSYTNYYSGLGSVATSDTIDQRKLNDASVQTISGTFTYTEPIAKKWFLIGDVNLSNTLNTSKRLSFIKAGNEAYDKQVDSLSSNFRYDIWAQKGGVTLRHVGKKLNYSFGGRASYTVLSQYNAFKDSSLSKYYLNFFPAASLSYKIKSNNSISASYSGNTQQPMLQQLQPLKDNTNPLNVTIGNPDLVQSFSNNLTLNYNQYKPISGSGMYSYISFAQVLHDFASNDFVNDQGKRVHQTINVEGNQSVNTYMYFYQSFKRFKIDLNENISGYYSKSANKVNLNDNINHSGDISFGIDPSWHYKEILEIGVGTNWTYNRSTSSLRPDVVTEYWISSYSPYFELTLPKRFSMKADCAFNKRQQATSFDKSLNTQILNASVSYKFTKKEAFIFTISGYDLLNQNIGFTRNASSNFVSQNVYTQLKRFVMFSLTWRINNKNDSEDDE